MTKTHERSVFIDDILWVWHRCIECRQMHLQRAISSHLRCGLCRGAINLPRAIMQHDSDELRGRGRR